MTSGKEFAARSDGWLRRYRVRLTEQDIDRIVAECTVPDDARGLDRPAYEPWPWWAIAAYIAAALLIGGIGAAALVVAVTPALTG